MNPGGIRSFLAFLTVCGKPAPGGRRCSRFACSGWLLCLMIFTIAPLAAVENHTPSPVLQAIREELQHSLSKLKTQPVPPYALSYEITENQTAFVTGLFGAIVSSNESRRRQLDIDLRVGDYKLDNSHAIRGAFPGFDFNRYSMIEVPIEDNPDAIRAVVWYHTDSRYKRAVEQFTKVKTNVQLKVEPEDKSNDFSHEATEKYYEPIKPLTVSLRLWEEKIRKYTAPFAPYGDIYEARASLSAERESRFFVSSEGSEIQSSRVIYRLFISAFTKAEDGMELPRYESFAAFAPENLPGDEEVLKIVNRMIVDLRALRTAPVVEPYSGPALLSGRAAGVFFHEVFGHRIEGHRQKREEEGQTFKKKVNEKILPDPFSVYFDPTARHLGKSDLVGFYQFDNEGVKARRVAVVENGVFKSFLMGRTPIDGFPSSNGHGRRQAGFAPVARQSNLIVDVSKPVSKAVLKQMLIEQLKKENKPFGLLFEDIQGGFTITGRTIPNAFNVLPILVYRIYPDGREELVRGVDLIGTPLTTFSKVVAGDDQTGVFNGFCGAESGGVPVAAASPSILVSQIEVQKKEKSQERVPVLPPPF